MVSPSEVNAVTHYGVYLRSVWCHYQILYEESDLRRRMLHRIAPIFFRDLNLILIEHLVLQICKLTDPEGSGTRKNLTIDYLVNNGNFSAAPADQDRAIILRDRIHLFRTAILPARNKLISHLDLSTVMAGSPLGAADEQAWSQFWDDLDELVDLLNRHFADPPGPFRVKNVAMISDADSAVKALREGTFFQAGLGAHALTLALVDVADGAEFSNA
jgi:hypothetical protein